MIDKPDVHEDDLEAKKFGASGGVRADLQCGDPDQGRPLNLYGSAPFDPGRFAPLNIYGNADFRRTKAPVVSRGSVCGWW